MWVMEYGGIERVVWLKDGWKLQGKKEVNWGISGVHDS